MIASTTIGFATDFAFAIPIYGAGAMASMSNQYGVLARNQTYRTVWEPLLRIERAAMPKLWISWPEEQHFSLVNQAQTYRAAPGSRMVAIRPGMGHNHPAGWRAPESYAFASSVVQTGAPWARQVEQGAAGGHAQVVFETDRTLSDSVLFQASGRGHTGERTWTQAPAELSVSGDRRIVRAPLNRGATGWFINARSSDLILSSDFVETE